MPQPNWIIGGNYSYTDARFSEELVDAFGNRGVIEVNNPDAPSSFTQLKKERDQLME